MSFPVFPLSNLYHPAILLAFPAPSNHHPPFRQLLLKSNFFPGQIHSFFAQFLSMKAAPCDSEHLMSCFSSSTHVKNAFWPRPPLSPLSTYNSVFNTRQAAKTKTIFKVETDKMSTASSELEEKQENINSIWGIFLQSVHWKTRLAERNHYCQQSMFKTCHLNQLVEKTNLSENTLLQCGYIRISEFSTTSNVSNDVTVWLLRFNMKIEWMAQWTLGGGCCM